MDIAAQYVIEYIPYATHRLHVLRLWDYEQVATTVPQLFYSSSWMLWLCIMYHHESVVIVVVKTWRLPFG